MQFYKFGKLIRLAVMAFIAIAVAHRLLEATLLLNTTWGERVPDGVSIRGGELGSLSNWEVDVMMGFFMLAIGILLTLRTLQRLITDLRGEPERTPLFIDSIDERAQHWSPGVASMWQKTRDVKPVQRILGRPALTSFAIILFLAWMPLFMLGIWWFG